MAIAKLFALHANAIKSIEGLNQGEGIQEIDSLTHESGD